VVEGVSHSAREFLANEAMFLAADVGGTHARIGLVSRQPDGSRPVTVLQYHRYACAEWPSLTAVLQDFVGQLDRSVRVDRCAVASAGYVLGDAIVNDNLPWPVSIRDIRDSLGIEQLAVVNDFEAVAYATQFLSTADTTAVIESEAPPAEGPVLVMGPGTGLGSAVLLPGHPHATVLATEAGQIALAPGNEREIEILRYLARDRAYVSSNTPCRARACSTCIARCARCAGSRRCWRSRRRSRRRRWSAATRRRWKPWTCSAACWAASWATCACSTARAAACSSPAAFFRRSATCC